MYDRFLIDVFKENSIHKNFLSNNVSLLLLSDNSSLHISINLKVVESPYSVNDYNKVNEKYILDYKESKQINITCFGYFSFVRAISTLV